MCTLLLRLQLSMRPKTAISVPETVLTLRPQILGKTFKKVYYPYMRKHLCQITNSSTFYTQLMKTNSMTQAILVLVTISKNSYQNLSKLLTHLVLLPKRSIKTMNQVTISNLLILDPLQITTHLFCLTFWTMTFSFR